MTTSIRSVTFTLSLVLVLLVVPGSSASAQTPQGRVIEARQGDTLIIGSDTTIAVVRRTPAHVKTVVDAGQSKVHLLIDRETRGQRPDGSVDLVIEFRLTQPYPSDLLWDGDAIVDEREDFGERRTPTRVVIITPNHRICFGVLGPTVARAPADDCTVAVQSNSRGMQMIQGSFAEVEQRVLTGQNVTGGASLQVTGGFVGGSGPGGIRVNGAPSGGPMRVGGNIRPPRKVRDMVPVYPYQAQQAGIKGVVILEITIDERGKVSDARVLRSIPLLDQPAIDCVRAWEYEPTLLNGGRSR